MNGVLKYDWLLGISVGLMFAFGTVNSLRYLPDPAFIGESCGVVVLCLGLAFFFLSRSIKVISLSSFTWLGLLLLVLLQPLLKDIAYPDSLLFPSVALLLAFILSIAVVNVIERLVVVNSLAISLLGVGLITLAIQYIQLFSDSEKLPSFLIGLEGTVLPSGNISQTNQAAFVLTLSVCVLLYFWQIQKNKLSLLSTCSLLFLLGSGIGMTSSRGGVIMLLLSLLFWCFFYLASNGPYRKRYCFLFFLVSLCGWLFGVCLIANLVEASNTIERIVEGGVYRRVSLIHQAWLIFKDNLLLGGGWGNYGQGGLNYIDQLNWFSFSTHAHSVFPHIAAELGLLGLICTLPVVIAFAKFLFSKLGIADVLVANLIFVFGLYSFSEFPLWHSYYFFVFVVLVSLIGCGSYSFCSAARIQSILPVILVLIALGGCYYVRAFYNYAITHSVFVSDEMGKQDKIGAYNQQPSTFGFYSVNDLFLFNITPVNEYDLNRKLQLGYRVVNAYTSSARITKLAIYEVLNGQNEKSLRLFKSACQFRNKIRCDVVTDSLDTLARVKPKKFQDISYKYHNWLKTLE